MRMTKHSNINIRSGHSHYRCFIKCGLIGITQKYHECLLFPAVFLHTSWQGPFEMVE